MSCVGRDRCLPGSIVVSSPTWVPWHYPPPDPYSPASGSIRQVLTLASIVTVPLTTWGHAGDTILGVVDQVVALVAITCEVVVQHT